MEKTEEYHTLFKLVNIVNNIVNNRKGNLNVNLN